MDLERLIVASTTFRDLPTDEREALAATLGGQTAPYAERVVLHTCHRVELLGVLRDDLPFVASGPLTVVRGLDAIERFFLVAGGLDSAILGEEQVLGQLRAAYEAARVSGETGPILNELSRRAIRFGRRVRSEAQPRTDRSLADRAAGWALDLLGPEAQEAAALVVGTGEMGRALAAVLDAAGMGITIASRSPDRAERIVASLSSGRRHMSLPLEAALPRAGAHRLVAIAVRSATMPLAPEHLDATGRLPLVIDLSAPPAVTGSARRLLGERLLDLDRLGALAAPAALSEAAVRRLHEAARAEARGFAQWLSLRRGRDGAALLRAHAAEIRERHLHRLRRRGDLTPEQLAAVEATTSAMMGELLHLPTENLRREPEAQAVVRRIFGIEP